MLKFIIIIHILFLSFQVQSQSLPQKLKSFHQWLQTHEKDFSQCSLELKKDSIILCDGTSVSVALLQQLFKMSAEDLVKFIHEKKIGLEIFCTEKKGDFSRWCDPKIKRKSFKERYYLQGQFLGRENTILLRGNAYKGSLIHEFIHASQYHNKIKIYGRRYKFERTNLEGEAIRRMDEIILTVKKDEVKLKKTGKLSSLLKEMVALSQGVQKFSKWQDIIDERGIFLLYLRFGKLLGIPKEDIDLAQKNMGFICKRGDLPYMDRQYCPVEKGNKVYQQVRKIIEEIRPKVDLTLVDRYVKGVPTVDQSLKKSIKKVSDYIFSKWKIKPDLTYQSIKQKDNILPDTTLDIRSAHCVGLSTLYLLALEKMGIYAELIRIPRHVLVKACSADRSECYFIETLKGGELVAKDFYFKNRYTTPPEVEGTFYFSSSSLLSSLYLSLGYIANGANQLGVAEYLYKKSIDNDRRFADGYANLSGVYQRSGKLNLAKQYNEIALKINPKHLPSLVNKAALLWNQFKEKKEKEVLEILRQAQNINIYFPQTYAVRGRVLQALKRYQKAFVNYLTVLMSSGDCTYFTSLQEVNGHIKDQVFLKKYRLDLQDYKRRCTVSLSK